jgi:hypothetical protein
LTMLLALPSVAAARGEEQLPVSGALSDFRAFTGTITNPVFSVEAGGELWVSGVVDGVATTPTGLSSAFVDRAFRVPATVTTREAHPCDEVYLVLQPVPLTDRGLQLGASWIPLERAALATDGALLSSLPCTG